MYIHIICTKLKTRKFRRYKEVKITKDAEIPLSITKDGDGKLCRLSVRHYCRTDSLHNLLSGSSARRIAYITCRPGLPNGKLCRLSVRHCIFIKSEFKK